MNHRSCRASYVHVVEHARLKVCDGGIPILLSQNLCNTQATELIPPDIFFSALPWVSVTVILSIRGMEHCRRTSVDTTSLDPPSTGCDDLRTSIWDSRDAKDVAGGSSIGKGENLGDLSVRSFLVASLMKRAVCQTDSDKCLRYIYIYVCVFVSLRGGKHDSQRAGFSFLGVRFCDLKYFA